MRDADDEICLIEVQPQQCNGIQERKPGLTIKGVLEGDLKLKIRKYLIFTH